MRLITIMKFYISWFICHLAQFLLRFEIWILLAFYLTEWISTNLIFIYFYYYYYYLFREKNHSILKLSGSIESYRNYVGFLPLVGRSRNREKSYYLTNVPLKRSIFAEKKVHGTGKICLTEQKSHLSGVLDIDCIDAFKTDRNFANKDV